MREMTLRTRTIARKGLSRTAARYRLDRLNCRLNRLPGTRQAVAFTLICFGFLLATAAGAQAQTPATCGLTVTKSIQFDSDLICVDMGGVTTGIIVGANNITIDLHGFKLSCQSVDGYRGSCQGPGAVDPTPDIGIDINGFDNVRIRGGGSIQGFDIGIDVRPRADGNNSFNVNIQKVNINGPDADGGLFGSLFPAAGPRPDATAGIIVQSNFCPSGIVIFGNSIENHTTGVNVLNSCGVEVSMNFFHDNNGGLSSDFPSESHAVRLQNSRDSKIHDNLVVDNGTNLDRDGAFALDGVGTINNLVVDNNVSFNNGHGILLRDGMPLSVARTALDSLGLSVMDYTETMAWRSAEARPLLPRDLRIADRACLAAGAVLGLRVQTADGMWPAAAGPFGVEVEVIR